MIFVALIFCNLPYRLMVRISLGRNTVLMNFLRNVDRWRSLTSCRVDEVVQQKRLQFAPSSVDRDPRKTMAATGSWIARQWKTGWEKIPLIMTCHSITLPLLIGYIGNRLFGTESLFNRRAEKYRAEYTVMRSDDPRVKEINHYSSIDKVGIFS